jgi:uncharacterized membrane protein
MISVTMFMRKACPACEQAKIDLESLQETIPHRLVVVDVDADPVLSIAYKDLDVPVIQVGPYKLRPPFSRQDLQVSLSAAQDRSIHMEQSGDTQYLDRVNRGKTITGTDRFSYWLSEHYMTLFNLVVFFYVGVPFLAPVFMKIGANLPARIIYTIYSPLCHQLAFRSFFLFGEQPYYPRELAHVSGVLPYELATGMNGSDFIAARNFIGNNTVGYKVAFCERDVAIYGGILLFGLIYAITGRRFKSLPWYFWIGLGLIPIGVDGVSQLLGTLPFIPSWFPIRESTPFLRVLTGGLFGFTTAWYLYPFIEASMRETRILLARKFAAARPPVVEGK